QPHLPVLAQIADPLGEPRVRGLYGRAWERDEIVRELVAKWTSGNANWLIVGEPGAGKTTVACEAIRTIERKPVTTLMETEQRTDKQTRLYWQTSGGRLISGMRYLGMWQERLEAVIRELQAIGGVLCIESLNEFLRVGGADAQSGIAAFCIPYLQRGELRLVGEATPEELDTCRRLLPDFVDQFSIFRLDTMKGPEAIKVLQQLGEPHEAAELLPSAQRTIELFHRFERYQALPGEAVHFWRKLLASSRRRHRQNQPISNPVTPQLVTQRFIQRTGLPEFLLCDEQALRHEEVCQHLEAQVIGQPAACAAAADVVIAFKAGMNDPHRPLGTLLFCGPTGVGKTELSKALATYLFGNQRSKRKRQFLRLDMSEYSGPWAADRFLLKDDGEPSVFLQQIRQQPFNVVLFDEIEKAHPMVYDILLNILDEGRVTDRYGRVTWFRSALLILTSNLGTDSTSHVGYQDEPQMGSSIEMAVRNFFRPEFFNRLDRIVTFSALTPPIIERITEKELRQLSQREGLLSKGMTMSWTPAVVKAIAQAGFDLRYGARPLQNAMETLVVVPLARWLVAHPQATGTLKLEINSAGTVDVIALNE
ncbi:MAG: AAA family ATPase, partial [Planctomycetota bacterium]